MAIQSEVNKTPDHWRQILLRLDGAYAASTLRAYRADTQVFVDWCEAKHHVPFPATPATLAEFVDTQSTYCSSATIRRRLAAIRKLHRLMGYHNPAEDEAVLIAIRRAFRKNPSRPRQALGLNDGLKSQVLAACPKTLTGMRDKALIATGYDTLCRRSELVALRVEDICEHPGGGAEVLVRRSKNDPYGNGRTAFLSEETLKLLKAWLTKAEIRQGPIFRSIRGTTISKQELYPDSVNRILKHAAKAAGVPEQTIKKLSGHSMRIGAAQDMITDGMSLLPIMRAGGWRTVSVVARYTENADIMTIMKSRKPRIR
jgi:site-specific recombinase XerD